MASRAEALIRALDLTPHPEGGYFGEVYRSPNTVAPHDGRPERAALTTIYFLLQEDQVSRWHRVASDEAWHFLEGEPLVLLTADAAFDQIQTHTLGPYGPKAAPVHVVEAGRWQAARPLGTYALVACTVGPGFDYADFALLRDRPDDAEALRRKHPGLSALL